ncbi:hypothetical protein QQS21_005817 [Conoideocrella luteorostrata]|uniref:Uncharacterized protein n=1 Tax=Conoideocrella luteorostrata TaxID=1105319 RepID=A0AAJ0FTG9_9HYPO|nr:hypothetical protein QQS21_005817 [Conoideocrella luteorostrata]
MHAIKNSDVMEYEKEDEHWSENFSSNITIDEVEKFSTVPVYVGDKESIAVDSVSISPVKLDELVQMYEKMYHSPTHYGVLTDSEPAFVIVWMIAAENYEVNHFTVKWDGVSVNTFVHLRSTIDRLKDYYLS